MKNNTKGYMFKYVIVLLLIVVFLGGKIYGSAQAQNIVVKDMKTWHTARFYEDGSWRVEKQNGSVNTGCIEGGLCND